MNFLESIPEAIVVILSFVAIVTCVFNWVAVREYASLGYLLACAYLFTTYITFILVDASDEQRRFWARLGFVILLSNIIIWRVNFYLRQRKKTNAKH